MMVSFFFKIGNGRGFELENCMHLLQMKTWQEYFKLSPWTSLFGGLSTLLLVGMIVFCARLLVWCFQSLFHQKRSATVISLLVLTGSICCFTFFYNPCAELGHFFYMFRQKSNYIEMKATAYQNVGMRITPKSAPMIKATPGKNLVYIILESTENTFLDESKFPGLLPHLKKFHQESQHFDNISMNPNATLTFGAMFSALTGSYMTPIHLAHGVNQPWNPNIGSKMSSLSRILHQAGYKQYFLVGCSDNFAGTGEFMKDQHYDFVWSGIDKSLRNASYDFSVRDSVTYEQAWRFFQKAAEEKKPFNITLLTVDAHGPNGFYSPEEPAFPKNTTSNNLFNAMYASDVALGKFLERIEQHPVYENTCVVITNDHDAHVYTNVHEILETNPNRKLIFLIKNSSVKDYAPDTEGRTFDIGPTILDAMNVQHDYLFPLGQSLYHETDPRRLIHSETQELAVAVYTLLKSNFDAKMPATVKLSDAPFPMLEFGNQKYPLCVNFACDLPKDEELFVLDLEDLSPEKNPHCYSLVSEFLNKNKKRNEFIFLGINSPDLRDKYQTPKSGKYILGVSYRGQKIFHASNHFTECRISAEELAEFYKRVGTDSTKENDVLPKSDLKN